MKDLRKIIASWKGRNGVITVSLFPPAGRTATFYPGEGEVREDGKNIRENKYITPSVDGNEHSFRLLREICFHNRNTRE
jgi:hypothetical protein